MVRVVHLITSLETGGAEMMLYKYLQGADRTRTENIVVCLGNDGTLAEPIRRLGIDVHTIGLKRRFSAAAALVRLATLLRREQPQILQSWLYHADLIGLLLGKLAGISKIVWNLRCSNTGTIYTKGTGALLLKSLAMLSGRPDAVIANSVAGQIEHERLGYKPTRWELLPNGFDLDVFNPNPLARAQLRQELGLDSNAMLIGLVARFDPLKDQENFLHAAAKLQRTHRDVQFVMVGRGIVKKNAELSALIEQTGINATGLHLLGERRDIANITAALDIATCSSNAEGFPNIVGEAMACGVPCAVTDVGDAAIIVGDTGRVVPATDPGALSLAFTSLVDIGPQARERLGSAARARIAEHYDLLAICRRYDDLYEEMADPHAAHRHWHRGQQVGSKT